MSLSLAGTEPPRYGVRALADLFPSALAAAGAAAWPNLLDLPEAYAYVVFLIDGLGWRQLQTYADEAPYLSGLAGGATPLTCGVPSTTATSITSLGTSLPPGSHGVVGFTTRIPGTNELLDALQWSPKVDAREWQPNETVFGRASAQGIDASVVSRRAFATSGLTIASQRGARYFGADTLGERISAVVQASSEPGSLTYVYEGELDATGHRRGVRSWAWTHQLALVDAFAQRLRESLDDRIAIAVTADHGMVDVSFDHRIDVDAPDEVGLLDGVTLFGGEARFRHLYCESGAVDDVRDRWRERLGDKGWVLSRDEAIGAGWFGDVAPMVRPRLGDVMVASKGDIGVVSTERFPHEAKLVGLHGSLTPDEMLIPLLVDAPS